MNKMADTKVNENEMVEIVKKNFSRSSNKTVEIEKSCGTYCGPCDCFGATGFYQSGGAAGGVIGDWTA